MRASRRTSLILLAWLGTMLVTYGLLAWARQEVVASLSRPEAQVQWQQWRESVAQRQADPHNPTRRRVPKSAEPPALVLMRDNFAAVVMAMFVVVSLCFAFAVLTFGGLSRRDRLDRSTPASSNLRDSGK